MEPKFEQPKQEESAGVKEEIKGEETPHQQRLKFLAGDYTGPVFFTFPKQVGGYSPKSYVSYGESNMASDAYYSGGPDIKFASLEDALAYEGPMAEQIHNTAREEIYENRIDRPIVELVSEAQDYLASLIKEGRSELSANFGISPEDIKWVRIGGWGTNGGRNPLYIVKLDTAKLKTANTASESDRFAGDLIRLLYSARSDFYGFDSNCDIYFDLAVAGGGGDPVNLTTIQAVVSIDQLEKKYSVDLHSRP